MKAVAASASRTGQARTGAGRHPASTGDSPGGFDFPVTLSNFEGPFDLLLSLIGRHKLDVTEVALSKVTDDFVAYLRAYGPELDLETASQFLVVAATLLDLKAARLLPSGEVEDEEDLAVLEARDLLFARLLQYRAYKLAAAEFADRLAAEEHRHPRVVSLEGRYAKLLPEVLLGLGPREFAALAERVLAPRPAPPEVALAHLHTAQVSVRDQAELIAHRLRRAGHTTFRSLVADADTTLVVVGRFLALLELYREGLVAFEQVDALGELHLRWVGGDVDAVDVQDEYDLPAAAEPDGPAMYESKSAEATSGPGSNAITRARTGGDTAPSTGRTSDDDGAGYNSGGAQVIDIRRAARQRAAAAGHGGPGEQP